jgi:hydroxypyruvate reductase
MLSPLSFSTQSLIDCPYGEAITSILAAALQAVDPGMSVRRFVQRAGNSLWVDGHTYPIEDMQQIRVLGLGKAAHGMAESFVEIITGFPYRGLLIPKYAPAQFLKEFTVSPGGHPVPDHRSLLAGRQAIRFVSGLSEEDLLICLISGGGSALMAAPLAGVSLADLQALTAILLACGARIDEINTLRRHLDQLKGGGLAKLASPARTISLILSDVVNSPLEVVASGPTAPDPSSLADVQRVLDKYDLQQTIPASILAVLETTPETPKLGDPLFERVQNLVVGSNLQATQAALHQAQREGFTIRSLGNNWQGEACLVAVELSRILKSAPDQRPFCLVAGGETTVTLRGGGRGGRNQELALAAVQELAGLPNVMFVTLATDGEDGPTDAAGAVVSGDTLQRGLEGGLKPQTFLEDNDAYSYFSALGDLLKPGPSGTNVNDLVFLFGL